MSKLITKARAGVTLVELLVVILIVTILSVALLPMLQPFVVEAQYAAEAIPVIGNLRTKIGVFQYDQGKLPNYGATITAGLPAVPQIHYWAKITGKDDVYGINMVGLPNSSTAPTWGTAEANKGTYQYNDHIGSLVDLDYQDLKGKKCKPSDYQYVVISNAAHYAYAVGCFGGGESGGLKGGTGYAVCEIVIKDHKYIGTWSRYKAQGENPGRLFFSSATPGVGIDPKKLGYVFMPLASEFTDNANGNPTIINTMMNCGWKFQ